MVGSCGVGGTREVGVWVSRDFLSFLLLLLLLLLFLCSVLGRYIKSFIK